MNCDPRVFEPHHHFIRFLEKISWDHTVLLDLLMSPETCFLLYLLRQLKHMNGNPGLWRNACLSYQGIADRPSGSTADQSTGSTADRSSGSTADQSSGSTGDRSLGSTTYRSSGSTADRTSGSTADRTSGPTAVQFYQSTTDKFKEFSEFSKTARKL